MSDINPGLSAFFELVKQLGNFAVDSVQLLTKTLDPAHWAETADKTVRTFYGTIRFVKETRGTSSTEDMAVSLRQLRFEPSGIRELMRRLLLHPTPDLPGKIKAKVDENLKFLLRASKEARSNSTVVARNKELLDKIQDVHDAKIAFYQLFKADYSFSERMVQRYISDPSSVPLGRRQHMASELDAVFDRINADVGIALAALETSLKKLPKSPSG
jgi:hypothetical protein